MERWITDTALTSFKDWRHGQVPPGDKDLLKGCGREKGNLKNCLVELHRTRTSFVF